jgi:hypothetical protein
MTTELSSRTWFGITIINHFQMLKQACLLQAGSAQLIINKKGDLGIALIF